jgi:hypothetical protein
MAFFLPTAPDRRTFSSMLLSISTSQVVFTVGLYPITLLADLLIISRQKVVIAGTPGSGIDVSATGCGSPPEEESAATAYCCKSFYHSNNILALLPFSLAIYATLAPG